MLKIRLARRGRKGQAKYEIVAADARAPRDGRYIERLGTYNPNTRPSILHLNEEAVLRRLLQGAQPTLTVRSLLSARGLMLKKHLQIGVQKKAITQAEADAKFEAWQKSKLKVEKAAPKKPATKTTAAKAPAPKKATQVQSTPVKETAQPAKDTIPKPTAKSKEAKKPVANTQAKSTSKGEK